MGDILSKLQMVSEKIGVTETAHTIEEQVDLITESLDKIPASTDIATALDDLSEVAQNINNEEVYVDKTITANGEYLPAEDEATAYSKVTVNVAGEPHFSRITASLPYDTGSLSDPSISLRVSNLFSSNNGEYDVYTNSSTQSAVLCNPAKKIEIGHMLQSTSVAFTPDDDFDGFYVNGSKIVPTGETIGSKNRYDTYYGITTGSMGNTTGIKIYKVTDPQFPYTFSIS